ncbi:MAG: winged helix-turn-helix transcriptional regulator [Lachnospiraceae bacterium]|nr:winged helix-turn-helix transcriptional regulator [Lachnospiraceae bacterium]
MAEYQDSYFCEELRESDLYILTEFFKVLGNPTRIRLLLLLMEQDSCVGDLAEQLGMTQSAVSHQLNLLKSNKLVRRRRDGKKIFYTLVDEHVRMVVKKGAEHIRQR